MRNTRVKRKRKIFKGILIFMSVFLVIMLATPLGVYFYFTNALPKITSLKDYKPNIITKIYSRDGELIGEYFLERRIVIAIDDIPEIVIRAFIATEDARFYEHPGIDYQSVLRAFMTNIRAGEVIQGGSTITQQVTKSLLLSPVKSYRRKIREAILSYRIEKYLTKREILFLYLNQIYLGNGAYGVEAASRIYFNKHVKDLNSAEAAMLAGLPRAPNRYSPLRNPERARKRRAHVLNRMAQEGYIPFHEAKLAKELPLYKKRVTETPHHKAPYFTEHIRRYLEDQYGEDMLYKEGLTVYTTVDLFQQRAAQEAVVNGLKSLDKRIGYRGALKNLRANEIEEFCNSRQREQGDENFVPDKLYSGVVVGIDVENKTTAVRVGNTTGVLPVGEMKWARKPDPKIAYGVFPVNDPSKVFKIGDVILVRGVKIENDGNLPFFSLEQEPKVQAALICLEARTGCVRAMVGGRDFSQSQFNRAIQSRRQPGSAFKPIIYAAALDKGYTPATIVMDSPVIFYDSLRNYTWKPRNYEEKFYGPTTLAFALTHSRNVVTVKILQKIGIDYVLDYAKRLGITSPLSRDFSIALGSSGVSLLELVSVYSVFANQGYKVETIFIEKVVDRNGEVLEENAPPLLPAPYSDRSDEAIQEILLSDKEEEMNVINSEDDLIFPDQEVVAQTAYLITNLLERVVKYGTGWRVRSLKRPVAGKTGTTNNLKDAWFMGFTSSLTCGVWVGLDDEKSLGIHETGSRAASPIWLAFMKTILKDTPVENFPVPREIVFATIDSKTGLLATARSKETVELPFREGNVPTEYSIDSVLNYEEELFKLDLSMD